MRRATCVAILLCALLACGGDDGDALVVFDGQSLNRVPVPDYPALAMAGIRGAEAENVAVNGAAWNQLSEDVRTRRDPHAEEGFAILVLVGGTSDVASGDDGPTIYGDMAAYATSAREAGFDQIIAATIQPATNTTPEEDAARSEANRLLLADDLGAFDEVVDLAGTPGLDDASGPAYFDGVHPTQQGAQLMADAIRPAIKDALDEKDQLLGS